MINKKIKPQILLSVLWIFILLNTIVKDLHEFLSKGYIKEITELEIPESEILFYGIIVELPILMILFSRTLDNRWNKWTNLLVSVITILGIFSTIPSADMDDLFFATVESIALGVIIVIAWKLPSLEGT